MIWEFHFCIYTKRTESRVWERYLYIKFIAGLFTTAKTCLSANERINKMRSIHTMEYYSALKRNVILIHSTT